MSRIAVVAVGSFACAGCGVDAVDTIAEGLVVSAHTPDHVTGTFGDGGTGVQFDFSRRGGTHEAILSDARGETLEDAVFVDGGIDGTEFVEATLLDELWVVALDDGSAPRTSGDPRGLDELAARPEMQLVVPLQDALSAAGIARTLSARPRVGAPLSITPVASELAPSPLSVDLYVTDGRAWSWTTLSFEAKARAAP